MSDEAFQRWRPMILGAANHRPAPVTARTPIRSLAGVSEAVVMDCDDERRYVVKGTQVGRGLIADQVVGWLGLFIEAPVAEVRLIEVPVDLTAEGSHSEHFDAGVGHGSIFIPDCFDSRDVAHEFEQENHERFALLAVLYGWAHASDHQFLYRKPRPRLVYSVDHGHFFPGGPDWSASTLEPTHPAVPDTWIASQSGIGPAALRSAAERLRSVSDSRIAEAVAAPPDSWGMTLVERIALADYLARRRDQLLIAPSPT